MAYCAKCGKDMQDAKFCPFCGAPAEQAPVSGPPPAAGAAPAPPAASPGSAPRPPATPPVAPPQGQPPPAPPGFAPPPASVAPPPPGGIAPPAARFEAARSKPRSPKAVIFGAVGAVAMVLVAIGSALPWATISVYFYSQSKGGLSGDGVITIIVGLIALAFFAVGAIGQARWPFIVSIVLSLVVLAVGIIDVVDIAGKASVGIGLILCIIGAAVGLLAAIAGTVVPRNSA